MGQNGTTGDVSSLAVSRNCIAFCGYDGQIQLRKKEGTASKSISVPGGARYVRWTSNGYRLVIAGPEQVSMVTQDGLSAGPILSLLPWKEISALDVAGNGELVTFGSNEGMLAVWNPATGKLRTVKVGSDIQSLAFSPDHSLIACGIRSQLVVIDSHSLKKLQSVNLTRGSTNYIYNISFLSSEKILCGLSDGTVRCDRINIRRNRILIRGKGECLSSTVFDHGRKIAAVTIRGYNRTGDARDQVIFGSIYSKRRQTMDLDQQPACVAAFPNDNFFYVALRNGVIQKVRA
jgi:WD40 repeat protein